ncbi:hypothetical protein EDB19DRAFT_954192 [Suillus lakei]|nr:hypothetical protein EDB19DRAFT_954192 [Suillus lakei]
MIWLYLSLFLLVLPHQMVADLPDITFLHQYIYPHSKLTRSLMIHANPRVIMLGKYLFNTTFPVALGPISMNSLYGSTTPQFHALHTYTDWANQYHHGG